MSDPATLAEVFSFVNSVHEQCRNLIRDTARLLRDNHQLYLDHKKAWDYCSKPNDRFLEQEYSMVRRFCCTFLPADNTQHAAVFLLEFFHPHRLITPSLTFGSLDPGEHGYGAIDRWASYHAVTVSERRESAGCVVNNGPIAIVTGKPPKEFPQAALVRVPLESITDQPALERIVVSPLAAMLRGCWDEALKVLEGVRIEPWPSDQVDTSDEEAIEPEQA